MGRRPRPDPAEKEMDVQVLLSNEGLEIVTAVFQVCGFFPENEDSTSARLQLMDSIRTLQNQLGDSSAWASAASTSSPMNEAASRAILQLEASIGTVRQESLSYLNELLKEQAEMMSLVQDLEQPGVASSSWILACRSIRTAYGDQNQNEERAIRRLLQELDVLYSSNDDTSHTAAFHQALACLERNELILRHDFLQVLDVLQRLEKKQPRDLDSSPSLQLRNDAPSRPGLEVVGVADLEIATAESIWSAIEAFLNSQKRRYSSDTSDARITSLLVVGQEGSGKTHICSKISTLSKQASCTVVYPRLPVDVLGSSVGETEDTLVSMFSAVRETNSPVVLILDGLENILRHMSLNSGSLRQAPVLSRSHSSFLTLLDATRRAMRPGSNVLIVCTSNRAEDSLCARFDRVFHLRPPDDSERKQLFESIFIKNTNSVDSKCAEDEELLQKLLLDLVEATVGKTYAELVQYCRQTLEDRIRRDTAFQGSTSQMTALVELKERLQTTVPASLKMGFLEDSIDMRVLNARDLRSVELLSTADSSSTEYSFPMRGPSAAKAWKNLEAAIVIPLCRSKELKELLYHGGDHAEESLVTGGILLCGSPGSGKTEIALQCARYACFLNPTINLLEVSCTSLIHKEVGGSEKAVKRLFDSARKAVPCILLLDGIENIAAVRGYDPTTEGTLDRVLSTLLTELDGIDTIGHENAGHIAIVGITQNPSWIDPALKRPGRLQKTVLLEKDW